MEQIIILSLLLIILLLVLDKKLKSGDSIKRTKDKSKSDHPSIMGGIKEKIRQGKTSDAIERQIDDIEEYSDTFESETYENVFDKTNRKKALDEILVRNEDWEEENESWYCLVDTGIESGFATGVTFEELTIAGQLLKQNVLEPALEKEAVHIIQKVHGTELFSLLENSLGNASERIAFLLGESISNDDGTISSQRKDDVEGFDIREFV